MSLTFALHLEIIITQCKDVRQGWNLTLRHTKTIAEKYLILNYQVFLKLEYFVFNIFFLMSVQRILHPALLFKNSDLSRPSNCFAGLHSNMLQFNALQMMHKLCLKKGDYFRRYMNRKCCWTRPFFILLRWILLSSLQTMLCQPEKQIFSKLHSQSHPANWLTTAIERQPLKFQTGLQHSGPAGWCRDWCENHLTERNWAGFGDIWECQEHTAGKWNVHKMFLHIVLGEVWRSTYGRVSKSNTFGLAFFARKRIVAVY